MFPSWSIVTLGLCFSVISRLEKQRRRRNVYATVFFLMATRPQNPPPEPSPGPLYCPNCAEEVSDPLTCGDCSSVICRRCGTPLENPDELGIG
jgi:hypothetical protein